MPPRLLKKTGPGTQSNESIDTEDTNNIVAPANFEELAVILNKIQCSVIKIDKLVEHNNLIETKLIEANKTIKELEGRVLKADKKVANVVSQLDLVVANYDAIVKRVAFLEAKANSVEQRFRIQSIRVYNMGKEVKNSREAASYLYDSLFKNVFSDSSSGAHPGALRVMEYCHLLPPMPGKEVKYAGYNYIVKFSSRFWKQLFFDNKKEIVDSFNKANKVKIKVSHDYTYRNRLCLANLHNDKKVKRVTFRGDRVMFKTEESGPWITVTNPFGATADEMAEPVEPAAEPTIANESTPVPWTLFKWYDMGNFSL